MLATAQPWAGTSDAGAGAAGDAPAGAVASAVARPDGTERRQLTATQATIARRMLAASGIPDFTVTTEVEMDAALAMRTELAEIAHDGATPSINDLVIKACALALRRHPKVNASYVADAFEFHDRVNVGVAVAAADALLVPTVFDADSKSLTQIATETRTLVERARGGKLSPQELKGATFTVSNLGMYGISHFTAAINSPQAAILAVGSVVEHVQLRDGVVVAVQRLSATLTCDHRILYGADAAAFLRDVRANLERPLRLAL